MTSHSHNDHSRQRQEGDTSYSGNEAVDKARGLARNVQINVRVLCSDQLKIRNHISFFDLEFSRAMRTGSSPPQFLDSIVPSPKLLWGSLRTDFFIIHVHRIGLVVSHHGRNALEYLTEYGKNLPFSSRKVMISTLMKVDVCCAKTPDPPAEHQNPQSDCSSNIIEEASTSLNC